MIDKREQLKALFDGLITAEELGTANTYCCPIFIGEPPKGFEPPAWVARNPNFITHIVITEI